MSVTIDNALINQSYKAIADISKTASNCISSSLQFEELANGRSVLVKTTVGGEHWVTVTGTVDGNPANSFDDFVGVDPWYNAGNPNNPPPSTGDGAASSNRAGVITLSDVINQNLHPDYRIITYKPGTEAAF